MKNQVVVTIGLGVLLLVWRPPAVSADAVTVWNENAANAATASCLHISGNGLVESRMYAMVHIAIHDAVNAIERRSRPYVFDSQASGAASLDAAIAAAARDVLVSVISTLPESPECRAAGIANANGSYAAALAAIPNGPTKDNGIAVGQVSAAAIIALRADDDPTRHWSISTTRREPDRVNGASRPTSRFRWRLDKTGRMSRRSSSSVILSFVRSGRIALEAPVRG